jgi:hypothetical protein
MARRRFITRFMRRVTEPPPKDQNPTARVIINGLGLLCFSKRHGGRAEVGFLETASHHPLVITIYDRFCEIYRNFPPLRNEAEISVNSNHPGLGQLYTPDLTERPQSSDNEDFRHLLNLDEMHRTIFGRQNVQIKRNSTYLAKLFISNATFYNAQRSRNAARIRHRERFGRRVTNFPRIGKVIGANIMDTQILVRVNSEEFTLINDARSPYTISIRYKCLSDERAETDFERFHNVLALDQDDVLDIFYGRAEPRHKLPCEDKFERDFEGQRLSEEAYRSEGLAQLFESLKRAEEACQTSTKPECPGNLLGEPETCP